MAPRVDAQRNIDALLAAAKTEFAEQGVDVNVRAIADRAGVGTATLYRHFPLRSDLISAVMRSEIDAVVAEGRALPASYGPDEALERFVLRYTKFVATKRGLAAALHSGDPAFAALPMAAADDTSIMRLFRTGPRSLTVTTTLRSFFGLTTRTCVPIGSVRCAAVSAVGS